MRIALVSPYMPPHAGGIEQIAATLFDGYQRAGHAVRWLSSRAPSTSAAREDSIVRVPCFNAIEDRLGVPVPIWGPSGFRELRTAIDWADIAHVVECLYVPSVMAVLAARLGQTPCVLSQNIGFVPYSRRALEALERLAYATVGRWVLLNASHLVLSTPTAEQFIRPLLGRRLRSVSVFPVGIDTAVFRPAGPAERAAARASLGLGDGGPVAAFVGRLVEKKGVPLVLAVAALLPHVSFLMAGDGPLRALESTAPPNVRFVGRLAADDVVRLYRAADALLLPSQGEGLPLAVQEATTCGLPVVISSDEVYAAELLEQAWCYGAPRDPSALAERLAVALDAPAGYRARARDYAVQHWTRERMIERHLAIMAGLLAGRTPPERGA